MADPSELLSLAKRRGFLWPAYDIYGGVAGLYDYGPLGAEMKRNIEEYWRKLYARQEGFLEISCPMLAPKEVFEASGHLKEFTDLVVQCKKCKLSFRADHLAEGLHEHPSTLKRDELWNLLMEHEVSCPECKGEITEPVTFNLMFKTAIGAGAAGRDGYMRPETAQGMFVNFSTLFRLGREKLPVGAIQIGRSMRNEISPRQGVLRLREFNMMEAELFIHPEKKNWPMFPRVENEKLMLLPGGCDCAVEMSLKEAVDKKTIINEALAYFMWLTWKFLLDMGMDRSRLRFRQHSGTEIAHYATDCWDCEALLGYGWVELVGIADRGCFDVSQHLKHSGADLAAFERFDEPKEMENDKVKPIHAKLGPLFKAKAAKVAEALSALSPGDIPKGCSELELNCRRREVPRSEGMLSDRQSEGEGIGRENRATCNRAVVRSGQDTLRTSRSRLPQRRGVYLPQAERESLSDQARRLPTCEQRWH